MKRREFIKNTSLGTLFIPLHQVNNFSIIYNIGINFNLINYDRNSLFKLYNKVLILSDNNLELSHFNQYLIKLESLNISYQKGILNPNDFNNEIDRLVESGSYNLSFDDFKNIHIEKFNGKSTFQNIVEHYKEHENLYAGLGLAALSVSFIIGGGLILVPTAAFTAEASLIAFSAGAFSSVVSVADFAFGNSERNNKSKNLNSFTLINNLNSGDKSDFDKKLLSKLINDSKFKFKVSIDKNQITENKFDKVNDDYTNEVFNKLGDESLSKKELDEILANFLNNIKKENEKLIQSLADLEKNKADEVKASYEKGLFYQSIGNALNQAASKFMAPKEAKAFGVFVNGATQMLIQGAAFGPYGWAAVAINLGMTLINDNEDNFQEVFIEAILHIQEQLNLIIKKLDRIEENQYRMFEALGKIYNIIVQNNEVVNKNFHEVISTQNEILRRLGQQKREDLRSKYNDANSNLKLILKDNFDSDNSFIKKQFLDLRLYALNDLNKSAFTGYIDVDISGKTLKKSIFFYERENRLEKKAIVNFFDFIGLIPLVYNYNSKLDKASSLIKLPNLYELNFTVTDILNWFAYDKLNKRQERILLKDLENYLVDIKDKLNYYAQKSAIDKIKASYLQNIDSIVAELDSYFQIHKTEFYQNKTENFKNVALKSTESFFVNDDEYFKTLSIGDSFYLKNHEQREDGYVWQYEELVRENRILYSDFIESDFILDNEGNRKYEPKYQAQYYQPSNWDIYDLMFECGIFSELKKINVTGPRRHDYCFKCRVKGVLKGYEIDLQLSYVILPQKNNLNNNLPYRVIGFRPLPAYLMKEMDWKDNLRSYFNTVYNLNINSIIEDFNTNYSFIEFLVSLFQGFMNRTKENLVEEVINKIELNDKVDGIGISLLILSKLNNLISSSEIMYFTSNYYDKLFIMEDYSQLLKYILYLSTIHESKNLYLEYILENQISQNNNTNSPYVINHDDGSSRILDANSFYDFILISIKEKALKTINYIDDLVFEISDSDSEPFIADALNKINGFNKLREV